MPTVEAELIEHFSARQGHFAYESGHHGDLWLDLDSFFQRPRLVRPFAARLANALSHIPCDFICGPMTGGALLAQMVAEELDTRCCFSERTGPAAYCISPAVR